MKSLAKAMARIAKCSAMGTVVTFIVAIITNSAPLAEIVVYLLLMTAVSTLAMTICLACCCTPQFMGNHELIPCPVPNTDEDDEESQEDE